MKHPNGSDTAAHARRDDGRAFLPDPYDAKSTRDHSVRSKEALADTLGQEFIASATNGEEQTTEDLNAITEEEMGGPFLQTTAQEEFAGDTDEMNPVDGAREPFPRAVGGGTDN